MFEGRMKGEGGDETHGDEWCLQKSIGELEGMHSSSFATETLNWCSLAPHATESTRRFELGALVGEKAGGHVVEVLGFGGGAGTGAGAQGGFGSAGHEQPVYGKEETYVFRAVDVGTDDRCGQHQEEDGEEGEKKREGAHRYL
ncbi:hypothetical protein PFISCL1PPCAC_208, partial [Pristionchus fissidentatus]